MNRTQILLSCLLLPASITAQASEIQLGLSFVPLLMDAPALHVNYRLAQNHYQLGYKYERWTNNDQNAGGQPRTTHSRQGPLLLYLFEPTASSTYYVGAQLMKWTAHEQPLAAGTTGIDASSIDWYGGAGTTGHVGDRGYYNLGFFISPSADMSNPSSRNPQTSSSGSFDLQLQFGLYF